MRRNVTHAAEKISRVGSSEIAPDKVCCHSKVSTIRIASPQNRYGAWLCEMGRGYLGSGQ
jgi:hypothetical protein